jgi:hypothetical protein
MRLLNRLACSTPLLFTLAGCGLFNGYRLNSDQYGFSVEFPEKPIEQSSTNNEGLPKRLWTVENESGKEFFSAEATTYKEPLKPAPNWVPNRDALSAMQFHIIEFRRFTMRAKSSGREVLAIGTTAKQALGGEGLSSIYVVDGPTLISVTARTADLRRRAAFLHSLTLLH